MRAIDADAIAYESIDSCDTGRHEHYYGTGIIAVRKEDIDEMPTIQPEPHWIPVTERLPEVKQRVIVQYADGSMAIKRCIDAGHLQWFYTKMGIVAWMPMPEPYKGVTE